MDQKPARQAVTKAFKARKVGLRKGHWRLPGEVTWYVDVRATGPARDAAMTFEVGAWVPGLTPEPEGGAVDCSLLLDVPLDTGADVTAQADALLDRLEALSDPAALRAALDRGELEGAHVDRLLQDHLNR